MKAKIRELIHLHSASQIFLENHSAEEVNRAIEDMDDLAEQIISLFLDMLPEEKPLKRNEEGWECYDCEKCGWECVENSNYNQCLSEIKAKLEE